VIEIESFSFKLYINNVQVINNINFVTYFIKLFINTCKTCLKGSVILCTCS